MRFPWFSKLLFLIGGSALGGVALFTFISALLMMGLVVELAAAFVISPLAGGIYAVIAVPAYGVACGGGTTFGFVIFRIPSPPDYTTFLAGGPCPGTAATASHAWQYGRKGWIDLKMGWYDGLASTIVDRGVHMFWVGVSAVMPYMQVLHDMPVLGAIYWIIYAIVVFFLGQVLIKAAGDFYASWN